MNTPFQEMEPLLWRVYWLEQARKEEPARGLLQGRRPQTREEAALKARLEEALQAKEELILKNMGLVRAVALRYEEVGRGLGVGMEDLVQGGVVGLMRALETFDPRKGFAFSTWAYHQIRAEVQRTLAAYRSRAREVSLEEPLTEDPEGPTLGDTLPSPLERPEEAYERRETGRKLRERLGPGLAETLLASEDPRRLARRLGIGPEEAWGLGEG